MYSIHPHLFRWGLLERRVKKWVEYKLDVGPVVDCCNNLKQK